MSIDGKSRGSRVERRVCLGRHKSGRESRGTRVEGRESRAEEEGVERPGSSGRELEEGVESRDGAEESRDEGRGHLHFWRWTLDARHGLRPIIHLPDLEIRIFLTANLVPPAIDIMRQRPRPHLTETVELGDVFNANYGVGHGGRVEWSRVESRGLAEGVELSGWLRAIIFSELSAQFRPRLARGISAGFR